MKLGLGTVQFGLKYGVANTTGQVPTPEVAAILQLARSAGITTLDTAIGYGQAESVLGELGVGGAQTGWNIITKLPPLPADIAAGDVADWCATQIAGAQARLETSQVAAILLHRAADLLGPSGPALAAALTGLKTQGLCGAVGVSLYGPDDLDALAKGPVPFEDLPLDLVQVPCNVLDQRLEQSGWAQRLRDHGTRIHLRSAFLQGLLLMPADRWPARFAPHAAPLRRWQDWLRDTHQDPLAAALRFAVSRPYAECVIIGVDRAAQLADNLTALAQPGPVPPAVLGTTTRILLDPREWT